MCYEKDRVSIRDRREMLKVKIKSLAEEARIIRKAEQRTIGRLQDELHWHRVLKVRRAARATHLAYGLIRGRALLMMEEVVKCGRPESLWDDVRKMIERYGPRDAERKAALIAQCKDAKQ